MFETVALAVPPAGSFQTATASTTMIARLRRCLRRSGPTDPEGTSDDRWDGLGRRGLGDLADGGVQRLGGQPVADPEVRVDVAPARRDTLELLAQLAHEDVDRAVAVDHRVAPHALVDLLA